ncbi:MAG: PEGA domain-containing protein, partial [Deltaproteobacteria bacterium]|nr:PEGA domain-containing protein [Deltaproteobacteria bacterium]
SPRTDGLGPSSAAKTRLGVEPSPARFANRDAVTVPSGMHAVASPRDTAASSGHLPTAKRPSAAPIVIGIIFAVAAIGAAVWFFILREPAVEAQKAIIKAPGSDTPGPGSDVVVNPGSGSDMVVTPGSGSGSATAAIKDPAVGSGSADVVKAALVDTVIGSSADKSIVEVLGTDLKGPAPLTAKLEKDKTYKVTVTAPGFITKELELKGGQDKTIAKLDPKKYIVTVTSEPAGAAISVDGVMGKSPFELKTAPKKAVRLRIAKQGFRTVDVTITPDKWADAPTERTYSHEVKLVVQPVQTPTPTPTPTPVIKDPGTGSGSAEVTPPPPPPPPPPAGGTGGTGTEPTPDWSKP